MDACLSLIGFCRNTGIFEPAEKGANGKGVRLKAQGERHQIMQFEWLNCKSKAIFKEISQSKTSRLRCPDISHQGIAASVP